MQVEQRHIEAAQRYFGYPLPPADDACVIDVATHFARFEASLPPSAPVDVFDWRGHWQPKIGSEVKVSERCAYYGEWQHDRLWVAGVSINRGGEGLNITVAHEWPQTSGGTDGFYINRPFQSDDLEPVGGFASIVTPSVLAESTSNDCLLVAEGWQDIASAPKDGSLVDLWWEGIRFVDCFWMDASDAFPGRLVGWVCTKSPKEPFHLSEIRAEPTHWRPFPAPPAVTGLSGVGVG